MSLNLGPAAAGSTDGLVGELTARLVATVLTMDEVSILDVQRSLSEALIQLVLLAARNDERSKAQLIGFLEDGS